MSLTKIGVQKTMGPVPLIFLVYNRSMNAHRKETENGTSFTINRVYHF